MALNSTEKCNLAAEMKKRKYYECIELNKMAVENKNRFRNLERYMHTQRREQERADEYLKSKEKAALIERQIEKEENLAREFAKIKNEEFKKLKLRQSLRENSHELRELESKLRAAYVSKELAAQRAEKEARKLEEKLQDKEAYDILTTAVLTRTELHKKKIEDEMKKKNQYKQQLQDQMIINEKRKRYLYEEFLREKKMIDEIVQRIHAEDERELEEKMCKMNKTRQEMNAFKHAQQLWRQKEKDEIEMENKRMQEFLMRKAVDFQNQAQKKDEQNIMKEQLSEMLGQQLYQEELKRKEREVIMLELYEEEQKQAVEQKYKEQVEKELRQRLEVRDSLSRQMVEKQERLQQESQEDAKYKEHLIAKMVEDEKLEQLSAQKKRMKMLQLRRDVEQMMIDRRQKRAEEMQLLMKVKEKEELEQELRKQIIEEERLRMLKKHAKNLIGYLPKGVLRKDDLPHLGSDIVPVATSSTD